METKEWPSEWLRGALGVCALHVISAGPTYGYAIATELSQAGLGQIKGGTLYPLLNRFEEAGLVEIEWRAGDGGPGRKFYSLTADGRAEHSRLTESWSAFAGLTSTFVQHPVTTAPVTTAPVTAAQGSAQGAES